MSESTSEIMNDELCVGDRVRLIKDIYDDGCDSHHPPGYLGLRGEIVIVREIAHGGKGGQRVHVSHEDVTDDSAFLVYRNEFKRLKSPCK